MCNLMHPLDSIAKTNHFESIPIQSMFKTARTLGLLGVSASGGYLYVADPPIVDQTKRFCYTSYHVLATAADYQYTLRNFNSLKFYMDHTENMTDEMKKEFKEYRKIVKTCNIRAAKRLYKVCNQHGGTYNKFGQYVSTLNYALPKEAIEIMKPLQDRAKPLPVDVAKQVINTQLASLNMIEAFSNINFSPIASASLAQVHEGILKSSGEKIAIKIQYPRLDKQVDKDFATVTFLAKIIGFLFPDFEYSWLLPEFEENLRLELDFLQEAKNGQRMSKMMENNRNIYIPKYYTQFSTKKMLIMEFVSGIKIDNVDEIRKQNIVKDPRQIASTVSKAFGDMIHVHGLVHCDPHPGNLLVRKNPSKPYGFEVILLDHGMYRRLDESFRQTYCSLWKALLNRNEALGRQVVVDLAPGIKPEDFDILSLSLTYRLPNSENERDFKRIKERFQKVTMTEINQFIKRLPSDLLFVMRSTNLVRSLNKSLGGTSQERLTIMGNCAIDGMKVASDVKSPANAGINVLVASETRQVNSTMVWYESMKLKFYMLVLGWILPIWTRIQAVEIDDDIGSLEEMEDIFD